MVAKSAINGMGIAEVKEKERRTRSLDGSITNKLAFTGGVE